jgi:hypothetical protein
MMNPTWEMLHSLEDANVVLEQSILRQQAMIDRVMLLLDEGCCVPDTYSQPCVDEFIEELKRSLDTP